MPEPAAPTQLDPITDFYNTLIAAGYTNIRAVAWDNSPDDQIVITGGGGYVDMVSSSDGSGDKDISRPRIDIQVRSADLRTAEQRALSILGYLHRRTVANCLAVYADCAYPAHWKDDNDRHVFRISFRVIRTSGF